MLLNPLNNVVNVTCPGRVPCGEFQICGAAVTVDLLNRLLSGRQDLWSQNDHWVHGHVSYKDPSPQLIRVGKKCRENVSTNILYFRVMKKYFSLVWTQSNLWPLETGGLNWLISTLICIISYRQVYILTNKVQLNLSQVNEIKIQL